MSLTQTIDNPPDGVFDCFEASFRPFGAGCDALFHSRGARESEIRSSLSKSQGSGGAVQPSYSAHPSRGHPVFSPPHSITLIHSLFGLRRGGSPLGSLFDGGLALLARSRAPLRSARAARVLASSLSNLNQLLCDEYAPVQKFYFVNRTQICPGNDSWHSQALYAGQFFMRGVFL